MNSQVLDDPFEDSIILTSEYTILPLPERDKLHDLCICFTMHTSFTYEMLEGDGLAEKWEQCQKEEKYRQDFNKLDIDCMYERN
jgi:hypothetical protein